jgi:hypothetical protein
MPSFPLYGRTISLNILRLRNPDGTVVEIGPEHPDYARLLREYQLANPPEPVSRWKVFAYGMAALAGAAAAFYWEYVTIRDSQRYSMKLVMLCGFAITGGLIAVASSLLPSRIGNATAANPIPKNEVYILGAGAVVLVVFGVVATYKIHYGILASLGYQ